MKKLIFWVWPLSLIAVFYAGRFTAQYLRHQEKSAVALDEKTLSSRLWVEKWQTQSLESKQSLETLTARFSKPYPKSQGPHNALFEQEMMDRLHLLQKMAQQPSSSNPAPELLSLYKMILENKKEAWVVQRQALKNMAPYWSHWTEKERDHLLAQVDLRARNTWTLSDIELIKLFGENL